MSRCIWALIDGELAEHLVATREPSAKQWLFSMIHTLSHGAFVRLAVTLWAIWSSRRKAIHEEIFQSPHATHSFIERFISDLEIIVEQGTRNASKNHSARASKGGRAKGATEAFREDSRQRGSLNHKYARFCCYCLSRSVRTLPRKFIACHTGLTGRCNHYKKKTHL